MDISAYPLQEPFSVNAQAYHDACMAKGAAALADPRLREAGYGPDPYRRLAIWPAAKPDGRVLAFIHGGGWTNGYKEWMAFMAPTFTAAGVTFASIGYRLAPGHLFPTGLDDVIDGLATLMALAPEVGGDPRRTFIGGHSAGGHYAALVAVDPDRRRRAGLPDGQLAGCLPISGVYRFGDGSGLSMRPRFLGPEGNGADLAASPVSQVTPTPPPFLIAFGTEDFPHLIPQAHEMAATLTAAGGAVEVVEMAGRTHFTASYAGGEADGPWVQRALAFMAARS
jgi:acetyl esterase/lipase